jgi:NADPH:quinone reductase-like Zn-dependent oxidoreductase
MPLAARAFWITARRKGEIRSQPLPTPSAGDVVVRTLFSGISRGTEALVFDHRVPPGEFRRMRAPFQEGDFPVPVKYGYSNVGVVEGGPRELVGQHVFALYPHQTRYIVPVSAVHVRRGTAPARSAIASRWSVAER